MFAAASAALSSNVSTAELLTRLASNPTALVAITIQFLLGLAVGYYTAKIAKYVVALVVTFIIGALIGAWGTAGSVESAVREITRNWEQIKPLIWQLVQVVGTILVGPTALGFFVGLALGVLRR